MSEILQLANGSKAGTVSQFKHFVSYLIMRSVLFPFSFLPYRACIFFGSGLTLLLYPLAQKHRKIAYQNISHAFPELTHKEKLSLVRKHFRFLGVILGCFFYEQRNPKAWYETYISYDKESEKTEKEISATGSGVVIVSGHIGNWESMAVYMPLRLPKVGTLYKPARNPYVSNWVDKRRQNYGTVITIPIDRPTEVLRKLKEGYWLAFFADQNAGDTGIFIPFLNRPASTHQGPAVMSYLAKVPLVFYTTEYKGKGKFEITCENLGIPERLPKETKEDMIRRTTEIWTKVLESKIRKSPEQYFWVHRRWKTQPKRLSS
ncbi:lipid A biosynthesis (KDO)2-(lauroyl)-lipid IVA acyltransferase [Leptospira inadai serovar Lyme str. 10]|uniref:Lipid A biosynthesis (KDO)2-(Lauroyl)-lipid IVA acyltransferase n=2 Tax=Leptospira inadai serovar Lyme TaxID=293084 RepID=V6HFC9_9LEPT|nr:lauroyl acyltransferase [Leptospira inadai]EQA38318.1 lipid A biosynthesis (KDO)2-(lauroyl)-lipid IVA acyltransferase [Leptospira inadai serovar Lyme str. 10]PNV74450.1 lauroyl acyltransferase [Leptospira inadai serovar Lyme]